MEKNKESLLVVDGNNRAHAAYHAYKRLSHNGRGVSIIYGLSSMMKHLIWQLHPTKMVIVWDGAKSKHRLKLHPEYKGHRVAQQINYNFDLKNFLWQKAIVQKLLYYVGIPQVINPDQEADDMIYKIVRNDQKIYNEVTIVSGDKDFHQLIDGMKVMIWNDAKKDLIHGNNVKKYFGYEPHEVIDYLTLVGDDSDDIKGYPGMGAKYTRDFLDQYKSLENYLDSGKKFRNIERSKLLEIKNRNTQLIDLSDYYRRYKDELKITYYKGKSNPKLQKDKFKKLGRRFNMQKLLASGFLEEFINLKLKQS